MLDVFAWQETSMYSSCIVNRGQESILPIGDIPHLGTGLVKILADILDRHESQLIQTPAGSYFCRSVV